LVAFNGNSTDFGYWARISLIDLKKRMREAADNPYAVRKKGLAAARFVRKHQTIQRTVQELLSPLQSILAARRGG